VRTGAPLYGEHSRGVLREYGFDDQQIRTFEKDRAIVASDQNCL
jgi:crotonobetainyl-CoA:carnitine CoA-transferase CaiB-like acyl-CoA transferase